MIPDLRRQCGGSGDAGCTTGGRPPRGLRPAAALVSWSRCPASRGSRLFGAPESPLGQLNGNQASGLKVQTLAALGFVGSGATPFCSSIELLRHSYTKLALVVEGSSRSAECFHDPAGWECEHTQGPPPSHVSKACRPYPGSAMHHRRNQAACARPVFRRWRLTVHSAAACVVVTPERQHAPARLQHEQGQGHLTAIERRCTS